MAQYSLQMDLLIRISDDYSVILHCVSTAVHGVEFRVVEWI